MSSTSDTREWWKYWKDLEPRLDRYIDSNRIPIAQQYQNCLGFYSFHIETMEKKATQNEALGKKLNVMIVETHDIMRGIVACHRAMTLAPLVLLARTAFEIHCNLKYIVRSENPSKWADLYMRFAEVERLHGARSSRAVPDPTSGEWDATRKTCPEWFDSTTGKLKDRLHWTASSKSLRDIASDNHVALEEEYIAIYKTHSKFTHASPLIANLYRKGSGLECIPSSEQNSSMAMLGIRFCLLTLEEFLIFLGVPWPAIEMTEINIDGLCAQELIEGKQYPDLETARAAVIDRIKASVAGTK